MNKFRRIIHHPSGRIGLTVGLTIGLVAALMGEASKALFFVSFCQFVASRIKRP